MFSDICSPQGYSYVAPSIIFTENSVSADILHKSSEHQPDDFALWTASHFKVSPKQSVSFLRWLLSLFVS